MTCGHIKCLESFGQINGEVGSEISPTLFHSALTFLKCSSSENMLFNCVFAFSHLLIARHLAVETAFETAKNSSFIKDCELSLVPGCF